MSCQFSPSSPLLQIILNTSTKCSYGSESCIQKLNKGKALHLHAIVNPAAQFHLHLTDTNESLKGTLVILRKYMQLGLSLSNSELKYIKVNLLPVASLKKQRGTKIKTQSLWYVICAEASLSQLMDTSFHC